MVPNGVRFRGVPLYYQFVTQGRQSRSGRPSDHRTNVLTEIASLILCLQPRNLRIVCTDPCPARRSWSGCKRELQRPENEQILSAVATRSRPALLECDKLSKILRGLRASLLHAVPRGLKPPMGTCLHGCRREVNQNPVTMPRLKQRLVVMFWAPKWPQKSSHSIKFNREHSPRLP